MAVKYLIAYLYVEVQHWPYLKRCYTENNLRHLFSCFMMGSSLLETAALIPLAFRWKNNYFRSLDWNLKWVKSNGDVPKHHPITIPDELLLQRTDPH